MPHDVQPSPFTPSQYPTLPEIEGVRLASFEAGIRYRGRHDLLLVRFDRGTQVAGVLTRSKTGSAPVAWCREHLPGGYARALVVNAGNANAFTGVKGAEAAQITAKAAAEAIGCGPHEVFLASTGVIGEPMDASAFAHHLAQMAETAKPASARWEEAARCIMTTDTYPKLATVEATIDGVPVTLNGICKGSGMIAPDMATMLAFVFTDAAVPAPVLQALLSDVNARTFNCMSVDGDTSTSDTALMFATGFADHDVVTMDDAASPRLASFRDALFTLMRDLAIQTAKDGEGLTKFITLKVSGADHFEAARRIGLAIANSPLVKTAFAGEDANWGRIVMAVGKAGEAADRDKLSIRFGDVAVARNGERVADYDEAVVAAYMKGDSLEVHIDVGVGQGTATVWTCDLTHGYISINADYRS
ncbi:MAG: bifunctional glutamate N-acetyltransferase/amino-acid acetyltransferase ArgJ [Pseudomonadota bacterium]